MTIYEESRAGAVVTLDQEIAVTVARREVVAEDVVALELVPTRPADRLPPWAPGAHVDVVLPSGIVRQYSLCSSPEALGAYRIAILREPDGRGGSAEAHDTLTPGAQVTIRGPRNHFELVDSPRYVFIAGGIGITPILPMVAQVAARGAAWKLHYGGRSTGSMAFVEELVALGDAVHTVPQDQQGLLDLASILEDVDDDTTVYCCGPAPLIEAVEEGFGDLPAGTLRIERFVADASLLEGPTDEFEVELAASGMTVSVPADRSILEVVLEAGVDVLSSCEDGICGTCETVVIDGQPDHRDSVMSPEEHDETQTMQICVSRCLGRKLVLDL